MNKDKRSTHTYKCTEKVYSEAMKRAKKLKFPLTQLLEMVVMGFSEGLDVKLVSSKQSKK